MSLRAWGAVAFTALAAVVVAVVLDESAGGLGVAALVLLGVGLLHGARDGALRGTPGQNVGRVLLAGGGLLAVLGLLLMAALVLLLTGLCEELCGDPATAEGLGIAAGLVLAAVAVASGSAWGWRRLSRARSAEARTPRVVAALPGLAVGLVALGAWATEGRDTEPDRLRPTGQARVLATVACPPGDRERSCTAARGLRTASSGRTVLALWRTTDGLRGTLVDARGRTRPLAIADGLPEPIGAGAPADVVAVPGGGFVVAWSAGAGEPVRFARVTDAGAVRSVRATAPAPDPAARAAAPDGTASGAGPSTGSATRPVPSAGAARPSASSRRRSPATPELAVAATPTGFVAFAIVHPAIGSGGPQRLRAVALDADLRPRGDWRTARTATPSGMTPAAATADGGAAVTTGGGAVRLTVAVDRDGGSPRTTRGRLLVAGPRGARAEPLPDPRAIPTTRYRPRPLAAVRDAVGRLESLWSTDAPRGAGGPRRFEQQWILGPGDGTPDRPLTEGLVDARLVRTTAETLVLGLRPRTADREAPVDVMLVRVR